jgi:hypothetical protein
VDVEQKDSPKPVHNLWSSSHRSVCVSSNRFIIPPLIERWLYCNHLVCLSVRSHFRNRYISFY